MQLYSELSLHKGLMPYADQVTIQHQRHIAEVQLEGALINSSSSSTGIKSPRPYVCRLGQME